MNPLVVFTKKSRHQYWKLYDRPFNLADSTDYHEYISDSELLKYDYPTHTSLEESLEKIILSNLAQRLGKYRIELKAGGKLIGMITLKNLTEKEI